MPKSIPLKETMINKYITATILAAIAGNANVDKISRHVPRFVVNIAKDQLRSDYMEVFIT